MANKLSRRKFLLTSGAVASGVSLGLSGLPHTGQVLGANDSINVGLIGTGGRGNWLNKLVKNVPQMDVVACCDVLPFRLDEGLSLAADKAKGYEDYRKMLDNKDIDAVIIATPLSLHSQMAMDALDAGKNVYCEKTMTYDIDQAKALTKKVKNSNQVFQVGYQHRYNELYNRIHDIINEGHMGELTHITCTWNRNGDWRRNVPDPKLERLINWRMYLEYSGGLMAELSSHQLDIVGYLLGAHPLQVTGFGGIDYWKDGRETYDNVYTVFQYPNGIKADYNSITTNSYEGFSMKFYGTKASLIVKSEQGHHAYIYVEPTLLREMKETDGVSGATMKSWERGEPLEITVKNQADGDEGPTTAALTHWAKCMREGDDVIANVDFGRQGAISVHMANMAMRNGTIEKWKDEYNV